MPFLQIAIFCINGKLIIEAYRMDYIHLHGVGGYM